MTDPLASIPAEARNAIADWLEAERTRHYFDGNPTVVEHREAVQSADDAWEAVHVDGAWQHLALIASVLRGDPGSGGSERGDE